MAAGKERRTMAWTFHARAAGEEDEEGRDRGQVQDAAHILPGSAPVDTSEAGAEHFRGKAPNRREWVLKRILGAGEQGKTNAELVDEWGGKKYTNGIQPGIQPRTTELKQLGKIKDSGRRRARPGGLASIVWIGTTVAEEIAVVTARDLLPSLFRISPQRCAYATADQILESIAVGGLFADRQHIARLIQEHAINAALKGSDGKGTR